MERVQNYFEIIIENLKRFPYDKFNVRDLFGDEDEWFTIPLETRQELGIMFFNYIRKHEYIKKSSEHLKVLTGATVYEDTRFEVDAKDIMYVENMHCMENSIYLSLKKAHVYYLDEESYNRNEFSVRENDTKTYNLRISGLQFDTESLQISNYVQLNKSYSKKIFNDNNFEILLGSDTSLSQHIYFLKSIPNDDDTALYYSLLGIKYNN